MTAPGNVQIRLRGVTKSFGERRVLDALDLDVHEGESLVVIGGSGTGKSVLLKHIIGLLAPDAGTVEVDGVRIHDLDYRQMPEFRRRFGMAFQEGALFDSMNVWENVAFPLRRARWERERIAARVAECLEMVHLEGAERKMPSQLSGGMRRRVGFARAIALGPRILLFDEPTTGLDPVARAEVLEALADVLRDERRSVLFSSHNTHDVEQLADHIAFLHGGRLVARADKESFLDNWRRVLCLGDLPPALAQWSEVAQVRHSGSQIEVKVRAWREDLPERLAAQGLNVQRVDPMALEDIFVTAVRAGGAA